MQVAGVIKGRTSGCSVVTVPSRRAAAGRSSHSSEGGHDACDRGDELDSVAGGVRHEDVSVRVSPDALGTVDRLRGGGSFDVGGGCGATACKGVDDPSRDGDHSDLVVVVVNHVDQVASVPVQLHGTIQSSDCRTASVT